MTGIHGLNQSEQPALESMKVLQNGKPEWHYCRDCGSRWKYNRTEPGTAKYEKCPDSHTCKNCGQVLAVV